MKRFGFVLSLVLTILVVMGLSACTPGPGPEPLPPATPVERPTALPTRTATPVLAPTSLPVLRVAVDAANRPWCYLDASGELVGLDVDVLAALGRQLGVSIEPQNVAPHLLLTGLEQRRYEVAASGLVSTTERAQQAALSVPYATVSQIVVVRWAEAAIGGGADLRGRQVGVQIGSMAVAEARRLGAVVRLYDDLDIALGALARGEVAAVLGDRLQAAAYLRFHPEAQLRLVGTPMAAQPVALAVAKGNTALLTRVNAALEALRAAGVLAEIERRWLATE